MTYRAGVFPVLLSAGLAWAQAPPKPTADPPKQASFGLEDSKVIQTLPQSKPVLGKAGPAPRLADGKPDLSGPWEPNAIRENVRSGRDRRSDSVPSRSQSDLRSTPGQRWGRMTRKRAVFRPESRA